MINMEIETRLSVKEALGRVKSFFGKGGLNLKIVEENDSCLQFAGGGGYVRAVVCEAKGKSKIEIISQEWEIQVQKFASSLPR